MADVMLSHIKKVYEKDVVAVEDFNLDISHGEFIVLVGPSGCGKSTTLRMIAGLEEITEGTLKIGGKTVNGIEPKDRDIAMVFQNYALYPHMTVYENMAFALRLRKVKKKEIDKKVREAAEILGITGYLKRKPRALSGGQRQRVAIGRAIVREPKVFLMDEPLSNLDAKLRNQMRSELIKLRKRIDSTFIYVTHDQTEAMTLGDRIVVMKDGVIEQTGTPHDVYSFPQNVFVASFIGSPQMNFFQGEISGGELKMGDMSVRLQDPPAQGQVTVGLRPEHIYLSEDGFPARVEVSELMGSDVHIHVNAPFGEAVAKIGIEEHDPNAQEVRLSFKAEKLHFFDREGRRL